ncbi:MAG: ribosomal-processing cysteine protease Prp [Roseburia sp.]|nr:ribosomal-processing cysteine protease Prp [Roseburia sp.]
MTRITVYKSNNDRYTRFTCEGHSGFAASGKDIVCAAISVLVINTINALETFTGDTPEVLQDEEGGRIDCRFQSETSEDATLLMNAMILGLETIAEQWGGKYLKLKFREV